MTTAFQEALAKVKDQQHIVKNSDERAVELGVLLPLLRNVGWDTEDLRQVYPQMGMSQDKRDSVDYALQIDGKSRAFIEVKQWGKVLRKDYEQRLRDYCIESREKPKPEIAVLTNGLEWRLYLRPLSQRRKN